MWTMTDSSYWDNRVLKYGHTGWYDYAIYAFDQPVRLLVMSKIIREEVSTLLSALDFGTGDGDFALILSEIFNDVKAFDVSEQACQIAEKKFRDKPNIKLMHGEAIYNCPIGIASLDLILSVTVLQSINNISELDNILKFFNEIMKPNARLIMLEYAPLHPPSSTQHYQSNRLFNEWIEAFDRHDFMLKKYYGFYHPLFSPVASYKKYHFQLLFSVLKHFYALNSVKKYLRNRASAMIADASEYYWTGRPDDPMKIMILQKGTKKDDSD